MTKKYKSLLSAELYCSEDKKEDIIDALEKISSLYTSDMLGWLGNLFDAEIGGFYYSNSARDNDEFLPDIESTYQAINILQRSGAISSYDNIPEWIRSKIAFFICSREDSETGFFYHPQWSKNPFEISPARLSRDLSAAVSLSKSLGFDLPYPSAINNRDNRKDGGVLEFLSSEDAFISYIEGMPFTLRTVHKICSQSEFVNSAGLIDSLCNWFISKQYEETGLWSVPDDPDPVSIFHCIISFFNENNRYLPNAHKAIPHIMKFMSGPDVDDICHMTNGWRSVYYILKNQEHGGEDDIDLIKSAKEEIFSSAMCALMNTMKILSLSRKPDGSFSYLPYETSSTSQGMSVAIPHTNEGDINATLLAIGTLRDAYRALGISALQKPLFTTNDFTAFLENIKK